MNLCVSVCTSEVENAQSKLERMFDVLEAWAAAPATSTRVVLCCSWQEGILGEFREPLVPHFHLPIPQFLLLETF